MGRRSVIRMSSLALAHPPRVTIPSPAVARAAADGGSPAGALRVSSPQTQARGAAEVATCSTCPRWVPCKVPVVGICTRGEPAVKTIAG